MDINISSSLTQGNSNKSASKSLNLDINNECALLDSLQVKSQENQPGEPLGIATSEGDFACSLKASSEAIQSKSDNLTDKDVLHQDTKTLTCEGNDLHSHKENHINTQR